MNALFEPLEHSLGDRVQATQWETAREELLALAGYQPNWDGVGADPVSPVLLSAAMRFFDCAERAGEDAPTFVYLTAGGTVMAEFHSAERQGYVASVNIREPHRAEIVYRIPGCAPRFESERIPALPPIYFPAMLEQVDYGIVQNDTVLEGTSSLAYGDYSLAS